MMLVSYDISNNKLRTKFSKFLGKFGYRLQYSVFEITNSENALETIATNIKYNFGKSFCQTDSVIVFQMSKTCMITKFGYAKNQDTDLLIV